MKLLLDTCALIWYLTEDARLFPEVYEQIADSDNEVFVSAASAWEIEIKRGKKDFDCPDDLLTVIKVCEFNVLSITIEHAIKTASLPKHHKDPFDRILIAQAIVEKMILVISDSKIIGVYPVPILVSKKQ
ncbi:PilT domain-containing protein [Nostoc sp. NIES-3756]|uniref:type II toxin-antitoxin system VapC family toxin n=1 Tax=Nostoc sp. NIES-3756 TaxID=1751286 RepID=UPI000720017F|nr:type II toxin-antitoxin system VapC family toxin [Nostoc sp. NIES-3756]BAT54017.1 PilT domain-containing protein [Nostoc sp. NIES-3756]